MHLEIGNKKDVKMLPYKLLPTLISLGLLSSCATKNIDATKYITENHIKKTESKIDEGATFPALKAIISAGTSITPELLLSYQNEAILLTRTHCLNSVRNIVNRSHKLNYTKEQFLLSSILATGLMGMNGASSNSFEKLALGSAFIIGSTELFQNYYLLGPDATEVIGLLENALNTQQKAYEIEPPINFYDASKRIYNYATICTNVKINQLVKSSISKANLVVPMQAPIKTNIKNRIAKIFNLSVISDTQLAALLFIATNGEDKLKDNHVKKALGDVIKLEVGSEKLGLISNVFSSLPEKYKKPISDYWVEYITFEEQKIKQAKQDNFIKTSITFVPQISAVFDNKTIKNEQYGSIFILYTSGKDALDNPFVAKNLNDLILDKNIDVVLTQLNAVFSLIEDDINKSEFVTYLMNPAPINAKSKINNTLDSPTPITMGLQTSQIGTVEVSNK